MCCWLLAAGCWLLAAGGGLQCFGTHGVQDAAVNVVEKHTGNADNVATNQHLVLLHVAEEEKQGDNGEGDEKELKNGQGVENNAIPFV